MSLQVSDLNLPADKLAQFAAALADASGTNAALQNICDSSDADVSRLTGGYVIDPTSYINFARSLAIYRAYAQSQFSEIPDAVANDYKAAWTELTEIAQGKRPNIAKIPDPTGALATRAGAIGSGHKLRGRMHGSWLSLFLACFILHSPFDLRATPVLFSLDQFTGQPKADIFTLILDATNNPYTDGTNFYGGNSLRVTPSNGTNIVNLVPAGYTLVVPGWTRTLHFVVPQDTNLWNVTSLITNGLTSYAPVVFPGIQNVTHGAYTTAVTNGSTVTIDINTAAVGNAALANTNTMTVLAASNVPASGITGLIQPTQLSPMVLTNNATNVTFNGLVQLAGNNGFYFDGAGNWYLNENLHGDPGGSISATPPSIFYVDDYGNGFFASLFAISVPNAGSAYGGYSLGDQIAVNGDWNLFSDGTGNLKFTRFGTPGNTNNGLKGSIDQVGNLNFRSSGTTPLNATNLVGQINPTNLPQSIATNMAATAGSTNLLGTTAAGSQVAVPWSGLPAGGGGIAQGTANAGLNANLYVTNNGPGAYLRIGNDGGPQYPTRIQSTITAASIIGDSAGGKNAIDLNAMADANLLSGFEMKGYTNNRPIAINGGVGGYWMSFIAAYDANYQSFIGGGSPSYLHCNILNDWGQFNVGLPEHRGGYNSSDNNILRGHAFLNIWGQDAMTNAAALWFEPGPLTSNAIPGNVQFDGTNFWGTTVKGGATNTQPVVTGTNIAAIIHTDWGITSLPAGCYTNTVPANTLVNAGDTVEVKWTLDLTSWTQPFAIYLMQGATNLLLMNRTTAGIGAGNVTFCASFTRTNGVGATFAMVSDGYMNFPTGLGSIGQDNGVSPIGKAIQVDFTSPIMIFSSNAPANNVVERAARITYFPARN